MVYDCEVAIGAGSPDLHDISKLFSKRAVWTLLPAGGALCLCFIYAVVIVASARFYYSNTVKAAHSSE